MMFVSPPTTGTASGDPVGGYLAPGGAGQYHYTAPGGDYPADVIPGMAGGTSPDYQGGGSTIPQGYQNGDAQAEAARLAAEGGLANLQQALIAAHMLPKDTPLGLPDNSTAAVIEEAMAIANRTGSTYQEALQQMIGGGLATASSGGGGGAGPLPPSADDVKAVLQTSAQKLIGKNLDPGALDAGVQAFYNTYRPSGTQESNGTVVADQYLQTSMPSEVQAHGAVTAFDTISKMLGGVA